MVDLVLDDLGRPAGKGADARLAVGSFVLHLDAFPALGGAHTLQRKTALLGVVGQNIAQSLLANGNWWKTQPDSSAAPAA